MTLNKTKAISEMVIDLAVAKVEKIRTYDYRELNKLYLDVCSDILDTYPEVTEEEAKIAAEVYKAHSNLVSLEQKPLDLFKNAKLFEGLLGNKGRQDVLAVLNILPLYIKLKSASKEQKP